MWTNQYCPNCCEWNYDIIISYPTKIQIPVKFDFPLRTPCAKDRASAEDPSGNALPSPTTLIIKCHSCDWEGNYKELLTKEEFNALSI